MKASRPPPDDATHLVFLVLRVQAGDEAAFRELFLAFAPRTLRFLRGMVGEDADDVQQEVWLQVYRQLGSLADARTFRTWLYRVTRHRAIDQLRRRRREPEEVGGDEALQGVADPKSLAEEEPDGAGVEGLVAQLPAAQREVVLLRFRDDLSYEEIAAVVGCSIGTVRSRLFYARQRLAALIQQSDAGLVPE
jgi:RNA polymerase sigma-70 factor (ECF subfamily)